MEAHHALSEKKRQNIAPVSGKEYGGCGTFRRNSGSALIRPEYCAVRSDTFSLHQFEETGLDTDQAADDVLLILQYPLQHGSCFLITIAAVPGQIAAEIGKRLRRQQSCCFPYSILSDSGLRAGAANALKVVKIDYIICS